MSTARRSTLPPSGSRLHRGGGKKGKARRADPTMPSALDRAFDEVLAEGTGAGGATEVRRRGGGGGGAGPPPPTLPAPLPFLFATFSILHGAPGGVVPGAERIAFADLDTLATR